MPDGAMWKVLVVDNNSTDDTRAVVLDFAKRYPHIFSYVFEPKPGKSNALNRGIRETNADVFAFMDDDVQVEPDWLNKLTRVFGDPAYSGSGGRIVPESTFNPPVWLETSGHYALAPLAMFDLGLEAGELKEPPFGTNMAFRSEMFSKHGGFRTDLGPQPGGDIKNEDVEFGARLLAAGEHFWYEPNAIVYHSVPLHRVKKEYFLAWWYGKGRSDTRQSESSIGQLILFGVPLVLLRRLIMWCMQWIFALDPARRFTCKGKVWWLAGRIRESFAQSPETRRDRIRRPLSTL
jgi:GT2 family glycosyltransferase